MAEHELALAINGRERLLHNRLVAFPGLAGIPAQQIRDSQSETASAADRSVTLGPVAVVGLGYVGLPTALALYTRCDRVIGVDVSPARLRAIHTGDVDLPDTDRRCLTDAIETGRFQLTADSAAIAEADAVIICVPTPVDEQHVPDLAALRAACATVVERARPGQTIVLTSTTFAGTTRDMLVEPLRRRGLVAGSDIHVAFSPERIDPGNPDHLQRHTPRVVGGATAGCAQRAASVIGELTETVYLVSSPEAAELTKLYENVFRAVTLALANEFADICGYLDLDPIEVTLAAGTKPYGFLGAFPGPGVGGHCIPCDPHYLLWQMRQIGKGAPLIEQTMRAIADRPGRVVERAVDMLAEAGLAAPGARVMVVGVSYKPGVRDLRESSALAVIDGLDQVGAKVAYHDPLVRSLSTRGGVVLDSDPAPDPADWDLVVLHTVHPGADYSWVRDCPRVLDATYQFDQAPHRQIL
ncbi:MAG TPA: nucleotide sugar dehydrogenase [Pseudonocardiaceae bacterium]|nr:nucleotide sugar dehydrogenase [Pseudonocardiaceae bacterium]